MRFDHVLEKGNINTCYYYYYYIGYLLETKDEKGKIKWLHREILKSGVLHKKFCVQSLWENLKYRDNGKNKRCLHRDAYLRMCVCACVRVCVCKNYVWQISGALFHLSREYLLYWKQIFCAQFFIWPEKTYLIEIRFLAFV